MTARHYTFVVKATRLNIQKKIVLYAEDNLDDELLFKISVKRAGLPVDLRIVRDGLGVIEWIDGTGTYSNRVLFPLPDLIVADLNMPVKNGFDVLRFVRSHAACAALPIIVYSSSGHHNDVRTANLLGATAYHIKSPSLDELFKTINQLLDLGWLV
jgi:CheY-like chemotaxis protein